MKLTIVRVEVRMLEDHTRESRIVLEPDVIGFKLIVPIVANGIVEDRVTFSRFEIFLACCVANGDITRDRLRDRNVWTKGVRKDETHFGERTYSALWRFLQ